MRFFLLLCGLLLALMGVAQARMHAGPVAMDGGRRLKATTVQDGMATSLAAAYSFRKVRSAYAGSAVKLRRTTGGTQDIGFTATGDFDTVAATTFCAATTCFLDTWYDQSTNARHAAQPTAGNQPAYVADCGNGLPCMTVSNQAAPLLATAAFAPVVPVSISAVAKRDALTSSYCYHLQTNAPSGNQLFINNTTSEWALTDGASYLVPAASEGGWHTAAGVINGASSVIRLDGAETTGTAAGNTVSGPIWLTRKVGATSTCSHAETLLWSGYALTASERLALAENQKNYWAPLPLDNFATPAAAYSMRRLKSTYSGPAIRLRRASDNAEQDIPFLGFTSFTGAPIDTAAANAHCAATTCFLTAWYDQSGGGRHNLATSAAAQPEYVANCNGTLPCARITGGGQFMQYVPATPGATMTFGAVAKRTGTGDCYWITNNSANFLIARTAATWQVAGGAGAASAAAADGAWHAGIGLMNGASSLVRVDAAEGSASSVTAGLAGGQAIYLVAFAGATTQCDMTEALLWDLYVLTASERAALTANQRNFWAIP